MFSFIPLSESNWKLGQLLGTYTFIHVKPISKIMQIKK